MQNQRHSPRQRNQHFFGYTFRYSQEEDLPLIAEMLSGQYQDRNMGADVYPKDSEVVKWSVANGFFSLIEKVSPNARDLLHEERRIVALMGAYPLCVNQDGIQTPIPIVTYKDQRSLSRLSWGIGTPIYIEHLDVGDSIKQNLQNGFYDILMSASLINLLEQAAKTQVDAVVASVESYRTGILARLTGNPLYWTIIGFPSGQIQNSFSDSMFRQHFVPSPRTFPGAGNFLRKAHKKGQVTYDRGDTKDVIHINLSSVPSDQVTMFSLLAKNAVFFRGMSRIGMREIRLQLEKYLPIENTPTADAGLAARGSSSVGVRRFNRQAQPT